MDDNRSNVDDRCTVAVFHENPPLDDIFAIRRQVFIEGQGVPETEEFDGEDEDAIQFLATVDGTPVGTARLRSPAPGVGKVERVAVLDAFRGHGVGRSLMAAVEAVAIEDGREKLRLHGQVAAEAFYHSLGFERTSDVYEEVGIPHVTMEKNVPGDPNGTDR